MGRVKRRNRVVSRSWTPIFLITRWFCHPLMKENTRMTWKAGDSRCCGRLDIVCIRYKIHSQGSLLSLHLCHGTGARHWTKPRALLCSQQAGSWGWNGFHTVLQAWVTQYSSAHLHCTLAVSTGFSLAGGVKITVIPALGCLKRPLALRWSYCKVALLVNSNYKLIQKCECGCKQILQFLKYLFMSKIVLDKMYTR